MEDIIFVFGVDNTKISEKLRTVAKQYDFDTALQMARHFAKMFKKYDKENLDYSTEENYKDFIKEYEDVLLDYIDNNLVNKGKKYDLYEMKNLTEQDLRQGYREITGLDNDKEFTTEQIYDYLLDTLKEKGD
jgi:hypothetical protein